VNASLLEKYGTPRELFESKTAHGKTSTADTLNQTPVRFLLSLNRICQTVNFIFQNRLEKASLIVKLNNPISVRMPTENMSNKHDSSTVLAPERARTKPPGMYKVILFNDDYTTMEFVIEVLQRFFAINNERAQQLMLQIHNEGSATCGIYTRDVAETKVVQVTEFAQQHGHPLRCGMEEI